LLLKSDAFLLPPTISMRPRFLFSAVRTQMGPCACCPSSLCASPAAALVIAMTSRCMDRVPLPTCLFRYLLRHQRAPPCTFLSPRVAQKPRCFTVNHSSNGMGSDPAFLCQCLSLQQELLQQPKQEATKIRSMLLTEGFRVKRCCVFFVVVVVVVCVFF
jgi:hypothetical protein